jgi:four helix bundle protein
LAIKETAYIHPMFLQLKHQQYDVYKVTRLLVTECYRVTRKFPPEEKFALMQQIRRAALSVYLNLAEGFSRKSQTERTRFFEIARGSAIEVDAAMEISLDLEYCHKEQLATLGGLLQRCFSMLSKLISH